MKFIIQAFMWLMPAALCAQVAVVAIVSKNPVKPGEKFELTFTAINTAAAINAPNLDSFTIISGPDKSSSTTTKEGKTKSTSGIKYVLSTDKDGIHAIGKASVVDGDKTYYSNELSLLVMEDAAEVDDADIVTIKELMDDNEKDDDLIYFKDGETMPGRKVFVKECADEMAADKDKNDLNIDNKAVCGCIMDVMASYYTYDQFIEMSNKKGNAFSAAFADKKSPLFKDALKCVFDNMVSADGAEADAKPANKKQGTKSSVEVFDTDDKEVKKQFLYGCVERAKKTKEYKNIDIDLDVYCNCTWDKIKENGLSFADLAELSDPNSVMFNSIITPCITKAMAGDDKNTTGTTATADSEKPKDIAGGAATERVELVKQMGVYKVKVRSGSVEKYFILDSGAGDVFITSAYERELLMDGVIKKTDYKSARMYVMANGKQVECRRVVLNNIEVGGYTVNNITAAISEDKSALLLLGKSFLDKFSNWSIDNGTGELVLTK